MIEKIGIEKIYGEKIKKTRKEDIRFLMNKKSNFNGTNYSVMFLIQVQKWSYDKMLSFKKDAKEIYWKKCFKKYQIGEKTFLNLCKFYKIRYNIETGKVIHNTLPERLIEKILISLNLNFVRERYINNMKWRVDFLIQDKYVIEVQGDYWHGNPNIFLESDLNTMQKNNIKRDKQKKEWILNNRYKYLEIWEADIYRDIIDIKNKIIKFLKG